MTSHTDCQHPATSAGRAACRRQGSALVPALTFRVTEFTDRRRSYTQDGRRRMNAKSVAYVSISNESLLDNFANRTSRPHNDWKPAVEAELRRQGIRFEKLTWSQTAGCSCPCSPGFKITGNFGHDFWVNIEATAPQVTDEAEAAHRRSHLAG